MTHRQHDNLQFDGIYKKLPELRREFSKVTVHKIKKNQFVFILVTKHKETNFFKISFIKAPKIFKNLWINSTKKK